MNPHRSQPSHKEGFSFWELAATIAAITVLAALTLGGGHRVGARAERNRTIIAHEVIKAGLEQYYEMYGDYPEASHPLATTRVGKQDIRVGGARMLYQALTGDGDSEINSASSRHRASDGTITDDELEHVINAELRNMKNLVVKSPEGSYLADGWQRPFQYIIGGAEDALNRTYDLWSFGPGDASSDGLFYEKEHRQSMETTARWVKNW